MISSFFPVFFVPAGDYKIKDFKKKGESQIYHFPPKFAGLKRRMRLSRVSTGKFEGTNANLPVDRAEQNREK